MTALFKHKQIFTFKPHNSPISLLDFLGGLQEIPIPSQSDKNFQTSVAFFRGILTTIEQTYNLQDFKFLIHESREEGFEVQIVTSHRLRPGPHKTRHCMSCDSESKTYKTSKLDIPRLPSVAKEIAEWETLWKHNLWLDAQARPMYIITPLRHLERLSDCTDLEIYQMFYLACLVLINDCSESDPTPYWSIEENRQLYRFVRMTLNHGGARNVEHLHLKVRLDGYDFEWFREYGWSNEKREKWEVLKSGVYRKDKRVEFL